jgi:2,4-dienoyl-CoA reductase-like NADH-dependent reductase (Old Yellow Enzyme family)
MSLDLGPLLNPFEHKSLRLRNRSAMAPMTRNFSPGHVPGEDVAEYYRQRAAGGVGLLITEGTTVNHPAANGYKNVPAFHGEKALAGWRRVVEAVHAEGGAIIPQLWHVGAVRREGTEPDPAVPGYSPSGVYKAGRPNGHAMSVQDIRDVVRAFADAARDAEALGFDGIEIHGAHGYLIDQFFWEGSNLRTDAYGGSLEKRLRFAIEIVEAIREVTKPEFAVVLRFSQWKMQDYDTRLAQTPQELERFLLPLVKAGVDVFHASTRRFWIPEFEGSDLNLAGWTRKITGQPTMSVGSVGLMEDFISGTFAAAPDAVVTQAGIDELLERMRKNEFDLIAVGRALLQDPEWLLKLREGRSGEIEPFAKKALATL